jgi:hypothetical protein
MEQGADVHCDREAIFAVIDGSKAAEMTCATAFLD